MTITAINRAACRIVRDELNSELVKLGERLGLTIHAGNASFNDSAVTFKVECVLDGANPAQDKFEDSCFLFDLTAEDFGREFTYGGNKWVVAGLNTRAPKYPLLATKLGQAGNYKLPKRAIDSVISARS